MNSNDYIVDFVSGRQIRIKVLQKMFDYAYQAPKFDMSNWISGCGTAGCLVGTYCINEGIKVNLASYYVIDDEGKELYHLSQFGEININLTEREYRFLFTGHLYMEYEIELVPDIKETHILYRPSESADEAMTLTRNGALARLHKFIEYKIRKSKLLENYEFARRREGNWNLVTGKNCEVAV